MINLKDSRTQTPAPGAAWRRLTDAERMARVEQALHSGPGAFNRAVAVATAEENGEVIVGLLQPLSAGERGTLLLDLEAFLKETVEPSLAVWLEPLGDRSSLRNLRGMGGKP
ncbi:hypothetical protein [Methylogaea oryzae]|uniref:Uncharacterized protein n=1 Tax=Methylogaea oryzae TaxID=1295382 RepID=A0A8D5AK07_9GAMM|nr:hypothetical protein [Methylogaea oryzae]BBL70621.1 hypothetical protein MoryE10_12270 [Methylogaea oryzae]